MPTTGETATTPSSAEVARAKERARELQQATYPAAHAVERECDLVMKGGITSGVVYPLAACELARTYRFKSIGGSSAGAIAASLVAAAEYGRDRGGFNRLAALPEQIGPTLPKLFTPGPRTRTAHAALMAWLEPGATTLTKVRRVVSKLLTSQPKWFWGGTGAAVVVALLAGQLLAGVPDDAVSALRFVVIAAFMALVGTIVAAGLALRAEAHATLSGMAAQGFGVCVGSHGNDARPATADDPGAFTDWLAEQIDAVAGLDRPLLVSDLRERGIDFQVMTTDLTRGRPMCFPFGGRAFSFDPLELSDYFPPPVIDALMVDQEPAVEDGAPLRSAFDRSLYKLPPADTLPVIVAARISLSFPGLIGAVPLYAVDFAAKEPKAVRCWFSDGGITSNFPIHFFDSMWPSRPTFALDLRGYHPDYPDSHVYYAEGKPRQPRVKSIDSMAGFVSAILDTMQYWADNAQSVLPGYRDRVVEMHLNDVEGGMNLRMPDGVIAVLAEKGRQAAEALETFDFDQHRWIRYLISMGRLHDVVRSMDDLYLQTEPGAKDGIADLLDRAPDFAHEKHTKTWAGKARLRTEKLLDFADSAEPDFAADAPRPESVLRITPKF
jgi:predicted acylesterase/phospholipase RssA